MFALVFAWSTMADWKDNLQNSISELKWQTNHIQDKFKKIDIQDLKENVQDIAKTVKDSSLKWIKNLQDKTLKEVIQKTKEFEGKIVKDIKWKVSKVQEKLNKISKNFNSKLLEAQKNLETEFANLKRTINPQTQKILDTKLSKYFKNLQNTFSQDHNKYLQKLNNLQDKILTISKTNNLSPQLKQVLDYISLSAKSSTNALSAEFLRKMQQNASFSSKDFEFLKNIAKNLSR